jgi:hypothetical protein
MSVLGNKNSSLSEFHTERGKWKHDGCCRAHLQPCPPVQEPCQPKRIAELNELVPKAAVRRVPHELLVLVRLQELVERIAARDAQKNKA